jgi:hypothetical protein
MLERERWNTHIYIGGYVQVENGWSRGTSEVLVIGLHMVGRFEYGFVIKALENLWSKKNRGASRYIYIYIYYFYFISFSFFSLSLFISFFFFSYFSFLIIIIFFSFFIFFSSELLQHNTYIAFVRDEWLLPHAWTMLVLEHKREGKWLLK